MKQLCIILALTCIFATPKAKAQEVDSEACLAIVGYFYNTTVVRNITAYLFDGGVIVDSAKTISTKDFGFVLKRNKRYSLLIKAPGYYSRLIILNSSLPNDINSFPLFVFEFDIELLKVVKGQDDYYMDFPIALVEYDPKIEKFGYSKKYTLLMQKEMRKAEGQFRIHKK